MDIAVVQEKEVKLHAIKKRKTYKTGRQNSSFIGTLIPLNGISTNPYL
jgi:hypothetical protein